jgi:hypothetical protein
MRDRLIPPYNDFLSFEYPLLISVETSISLIKSIYILTPSQGALNRIKQVNYGIDRLSHLVKCPQIAFVAV